MNTKAALLDSAEKFARQRGFEAFSFADLSNEVGIRKASIHHHFATKATLARDLMKRYRTEFEASITEIEKTQKRASDRLRDYIGIYRNALQGGDHICLCVAFSSTPESFDQEVLDEIHHFHQSSLAWLTRVFELAIQDGTIDRARNPITEANATLALMQGVQITARAARSVDPFDAAVADLLDRLS